MKLTDLLDQIDRLDQEATKGPWVTDQHWAEIASGPDSVIHGYGYAHCDGCDEEVESVDSRVALSPEDAEFIALARTALPQLAAVIRRLRECAQTLADDNNDASDYASGIHEAVECFEHIINDALGADGD